MHGGVKRGQKTGERIRARFKTGEQGVPAVDCCQHHDSLCAIELCQCTRDILSQCVAREYSAIETPDLYRSLVGRDGELVGFQFGNRHLRAELIWAIRLDGPNAKDTSFDRVNADLDPAAFLVT